MSMATVNGVNLYHTREGSGPSVVLVHGSWDDADTWEAVTPGIAQECTVVTYDRRGHSRSERPAGQDSVHEDVDDLAALIEQLDVAPALVCGNSYGALITLRLATTRSDLVRGIAVHEPPGLALLAGDPEFGTVANEVERRVSSVRELLEAEEYTAAAELFIDTIALGPGQWNQLPEPVRRTAIRNAPTYLDEVRDPDALAVDLAALASFTAPALLSQGSESPPMFGPILDRIADSLPHAERHVYLGAGHVPHLTHPHEFTKVTVAAAQR